LEDVIPREGGARGHARRTRTVDKLAAGDQRLVVSSFSCPTKKRSTEGSVVASVSDH